MQKRFFITSGIAMRLMTIILICVWLPGAAWGLVVPPVGMLPLNQIPVPEPPDLPTYVKNKAAAIQLGKALFWDMQAGSDGIQACGSCHYSAGADPFRIRSKNQVAPGLNATPPDATFQVVSGPNQVVPPTSFPFHQRQTPADLQSSPVLRDANDIFGSQGVRLSQFVDIVVGSPVDSTTSIADPVFNIIDPTTNLPINVRRVEPRHTPSMINAVFNFTNFWDGRANFIFNGVNPFGPLDQSAQIWVNNGTAAAPNVVQQQVSIQFASLASQATGPPLSEFEMSARGRTFEKLGQKMLSLTPLGRQLVHPGDSVLGPLSKATLAPGGQINRVNGLSTTYTQMLQNAFVDNLWNGGTVNTANGVFTQMEANFSLFWGLAIQLYEATLVSGQTPFDSFLAGNAAALTPQQQDGFALFNGIANCAACHTNTAFSANAVANINFVNNATNLIFDVMFSANGTQSVYDEGFNNTGVRPTTDDICRGGSAPFVNGLTGQNFPLSYSALAELQLQTLLPFASPVFPATNPPIPATFPIANDGAFKVPDLRNVELTAPYFHNGSVLTLDDVVDFYVRGGNFPKANLANLDPLVGSGIPLMQGDPVKHAALVAFLTSLTDPRVKAESAPFDHPEILIPNGEPELLIRIPAKDATGVAAPPPNLSLNPVTSPAKVATQTVSGTMTAGLTPTIQAGTGTTVGPVAVTATNWSAAISALAEGVNNITVSVVDPATSVLETLTATIVLDTIPPALTLNAGPIRINIASQIITGSVEAGIIPVVTVNAPATVGPVTAAGASWRCQVSGLTIGSNTITVTATDPAGNITSKTADLTVVVPDGILGGTGSISVADALKALRIAAGIVSPTSDELLHGDVAPLDAKGVPAPDGKIDVADALIILRKVVGLINF